MSRRLTVVARTAALALLVLTAPWRAEAQDAIPVCSFDTAAVTRPIPVAIGLVATPGGGAPPQHLHHHVFAAQAIRDHFEAPTSISLPLWSRIRLPLTGAAPRNDVLGSGLHTEIVFHLTPDGRLRDSIIQVTTQSVELNEALQAAVRRADSARAFPAAPPGRTWDRGRIVLRLASWESPREDGVGLMRLTLPMIMADTPVSVIEIPQPRYPVGGLRAGAEDAVDLLFVVGTDGRVVRGSVQIVGGEFRQFAEAAATALERGTFNPARVRGCAVPMQVAQRVNFGIR